jgi:methionine aminopeptidase type I
VRKRLKVYHAQTEPLIAHYQEQGIVRDVDGTRASTRWQADRGGALVMAYRERIPIKSRRELETMREAARHVAEILLELRERVRPGITTAELDRFAEKAIAARGVRSSFKGYDPHGLPKYPAVLCVSVNDEIVHGIPGPRVLEDGDIVSLDFGVSVDGYHGDSAVTVPVGGISEERSGCCGCRSSP